MAELSDKDLRTAIEAKMARLTQAYEARMKKYRLILENLDDDTDFESPSNKGSAKGMTALLFNGIVPSVPKSKNLIKLENHILSMDIPRTGKEIEAAIGMTSGVLSQTYRAINSDIEKIEIESAPLKSRFFYAHKNFLNPDKSLKQAYKDKIYAKIGESEAA